MRILIISNLCPPDYEGGFELSALRNAQSLRDRGHTVDFVTSEFRDTFKGDRNDPDWVHRIFKLGKRNDAWATTNVFVDGNGAKENPLSRFIRQAKTRWMNINTFREMFKVVEGNETSLAKFLQGREYDIAYVFGLHHVGTLPIHALTAKGIPILYHHGDDWLASYLKPGKAKKLALQFFGKGIYKRAQEIDLSNVCLVSDVLRRQFQAAGFAPETLSVIPRGIELPLREDVDRERSSPPVFLVASRLAIYKGIHIAIEAARILDKRMRDTEWELHIAGGGEPESEAFFKQLVESASLGHRVKFLGKLPREEVYERMTQATAVLMPSLFSEPFGNTNIEAMSSGTLLIASLSGAIEEIIERDKHGLIYPKTDPTSLADHMEFTLTDPERVSKIEREALQRVREHFTQDVIIAKVEDKMNEIVNGRSAK